MADQNMKVTSPINVVSDSKQRVAFDLALKIADHSGLSFEQKDKKFWFTLYRQCHKAASGYELEQILKED